MPVAPLTNSGRRDYAVRKTCANEVTTYSLRWRRLSASLPFLQGRSHRAECPCDSYPPVWEDQAGR